MSGFHEEFVSWARRELRAISSMDADPSELEPLRRMIGDATLVSFGEALHGGAEPLQFRNLLFRFLVERLGFTAIAIESGITEGYGVNDYVLGGPGELETVVARGFHRGFNELPQNIELVRWMREYNADPKHSRKVEFHGFILPGSDRDPGMALALDDALRYLDRVDRDAAAALRERITPLLPMLTLDRFSDAPDRYPHLSPALRDRATAVIADMIALFKLREGEYTAASSTRAFDLAYRSAVVAGQFDEYLRQVPPGWTPKAGVASLMGTVASSDRAAADNVRWILEQQGEGAKVLLFAHRGHLATALTSLHLSPEEGTIVLPPPQGMHLKRWYGQQLVTIANFVGQGTSRGREAGPPAAAGTIEGLMATLDAPFFVLDQRTAPESVAQWLHEPHELYGVGYRNALVPAAAFDIAFFSRLVTPAVTAATRRATARPSS